MNMLKSLSLAAAIAAGSLLAGSAAAQNAAPGKTSGTAASAAELTDGEIRKIDKDNKKLTIKHGDIKNLDMPGMTMVFQVRDPVLVEQVKVGDKVRFRVEKGAGGFVVTEIQPAGK